MYVLQAHQHADSIKIIEDIIGETLEGPALRTRSDIARSNGLWSKPVLSTVLLSNQQHPIFVISQEEKTYFYGIW